MTKTGDARGMAVTAAATGLAWPVPKLSGHATLIGDTQDSEHPGLIMLKLKRREECTEMIKEEGES